MRKAEREGGVRSVFSEDMRDAFFVSNNLNAGSEVCNRRLFLSFVAAKCEAR